MSESAEVKALRRTLEGIHEAQESLDEQEWTTLTLMTANISMDWRDGDQIKATAIRNGLARMGPYSETWSDDQASIHLWVTDTECIQFPVSDYTFENVSLRERTEAGKL